MATLVIVSVENVTPTDSLFLTNELPPSMEDVPLEIMRGIFFEHDGAPLRFGRLVTDYWNYWYENRSIGRRGRIPWPPRSPDLTPLDFF
jgi:hypothetical protein